jgi:hypothetical protein
MHEIILSVVDGNVLAETRGGDEAVIRRLFGSTVLQTAYTAAADPTVVLASIQKLNPGAQVRWAA